MESLPAEARILLEIDDRPIPTKLMYLWQAFNELHEERRHSEFSGRPRRIESDQFFWWKTLNRVQLLRWEIRLVRSIDREWYATMVPPPKGEVSEEQEVEPE